MNLDDEVGTEVPADLSEPLEIPDADAANLMMRRLRATEATATDVRERAAADIAETMAWRDAKLEGLASTIAWCHRSLQGWIRGVHKATGRKSVSLPAGRVQLRAVTRTRVEVPDIDTAEQAEAWAALAATTIVDGEPVANPVTTTWRLGKNDVGALAQPGAALGPADADGFVPHQGITSDGEVLPGVILHVPAPGLLGYSATPAKSIEDLDAELEQPAED